MQVGTNIYINKKKSELTIYFGYKWLPNLSFLSFFLFLMVAIQLKYNFFFFLCWIQKLITLIEGAIGREWRFFPVDAGSNGQPIFFLWTEHGDW